MDLGVTYAKTVYTHCGLDYLFDFDASYRELESGPGSEFLEDPFDEEQVRLNSDDSRLHQLS